MLSPAVTRSAPAAKQSAISKVSARTRGLRHELAGGGIAAIAVLGLFGRFAVTGVVGQQRDTGAFYYPLTAWLSQELAAGRLPLWCPLIFAGYPIVADGEIGLLYPPNLLMLLLLPVDVAFVAVRAAHYLLAAAGLYGLGRVLGVGRTGSVFGGVTFALGGFMLGHLDHGNIVRSAAWLPVMLLCAELALRANDRRRWLWLALGAGSLTLAGLGLHPQILLIDLVALGLFVGMRSLALVAWHAEADSCVSAPHPPPQSATRAARGRGGANPGLPTHHLQHDQVPVAWRQFLVSFVTMAGRGVLVVAVIAGLGLAGAAIQLIPTYELGEASSRGGGLSYVQAAASGLMPVDLLTLLLPYGFRADPAVQWMRYPYWESTVYVGVVGLLLTGVGLVFGARRIVLPLVGLGLAGLLLAMAANAPLDVYGWLWMLPGFSSMRAPVRYTLIVELVLALLAAIGVDRLRADSAPRGVRWYALLTVTGVVGIVAGGVMLRDWLIADEAGSLRAIQQAYLTLPRDRAALSAAAVRSGLLGTLLLVNPWTALALGSGVGVSIMLAVWAWRRRGSAALAAMVAVLGAAELLLVAHSFHPTTTRAELHRASRPMRFLSAQPGYWRTLLAGRSDLSVTSRPALFGVAQAYGYSSLPTTRMERYWTRVNEIDDDLLDLWNVRYLVQAKGSEPRTQAFGVTFDPARPLIDGPAGSPLGDERFRIVPTQADTVRVLGSLTRGERLANGETIAEVVVSGPAGAPVTLAVQAGRDISEAAYDESASRIAHRKATVGLRWEPHDPSGRVYPRDIYVADLRLPSSMLIEHLDVRTTARTGNLRLVGIGLYDYAPSTVLSVLPANRSKYALVYEGDNALVYENHQAQPRAYLAARAVSIPSDDWSITHLTDDARDPRQTVLLEQPSATSASVLMDGAPVRATESAEIERYESDRVVVRVRAEEARYLVLADSYFPGWSAWIDGRPVEVERANYLFRALEVPAGEHLVEWRYQPASLLHGAAISAGALIIMLVLAVCGLASRRRSHATLA